jgi:hypothetical protein
MSYDRAPISYVPAECPWCFEPGEISVEADLEGEFVVDCEVCCRPWQVTVKWHGSEPQVRVARSD